MAMQGRSIRLFLVDGTPQGMRTVEVGNWTGLALVCPRTDLVRLSQRPEIRKTGIYILVGPSDASPSGLSLYVGEGDEVWTRLASHDAKKDFWTYVIVFVSKDENLTKAHVRWLEAALVRDVIAAKRAHVENGNEPLNKRLPEADVADMETYLENVRMLLPTLGVNVLTIDETRSPPVPSKSEEVLLELRFDDSAAAECIVREGQFVVKAGSLARARVLESIGEGSLAIRKSLVDVGVLIPEPTQPTLLRFTQEYAFESPSGAASVILGSSANGRVVWKLKGQSTSYRDWQDAEVAHGAH